MKRQRTHQPRSCYRETPQNARLGSERRQARKTLAPGERGAQRSGNPGLANKTKPSPVRGERALCFQSNMVVEFLPPLRLNYSCHAERSARRFLPTRRFCGSGGRGVKHLCICKLPSLWKRQMHRSFGEPQKTRPASALVIPSDSEGSAVRPFHATQRTADPSLSLGMTSSTSVSL